jgi:hypothetical protein
VRGAKPSRRGGSQALRETLFEVHGAMLSMLGGMLARFGGTHVSNGTPRAQVGGQPARQSANRVRRVRERRSP